LHGVAPCFRWLSQAVPEEMSRVPRGTPEHPEQLKVADREPTVFGAFGSDLRWNGYPEHCGTAFSQKALYPLLHKALRVVPANAYGGTLLEQRLESCSGVFRCVPVGDAELMLVIYLFFIDIFLIDIYVPDVPPSQWPHTHLSKTRGLPPCTRFYPQLQVDVREHPRRYRKGDTNHPRG